MGLKHLTIPLGDESNAERNFQINENVKISGLSTFSPGHSDQV